MTNKLIKTWGLALLVAGGLGTAAGITEVVINPENFYAYTATITGVTTAYFGIERLKQSREKRPYNNKGENI